MNKLKKICFHIGDNTITEFWKILYEEFYNNYNIQCSFITDYENIAKYLVENNIEAYSLEKACYRNTKKVKEKALDYLKNLKYKDLNEIVFTQIQFVGGHKKTEVYERTFRWLLSSKDISEELKNVDVFIDFAGDELGHNVFDIIAYSQSKRIIKYSESLFPDRLIFTENKFSYWHFPNNDISDLTIDEKKYIDNFINEYFKNKKVFWGPPKEREFKFRINLKADKSLIFSRNKWIDIIQRLKRDLNKKILNEYYNNTNSLNGSRTIFYFPLHYPLDSQLVFRGRPFLNQIDFAVTLNNFLPYNSQLIVKEHPHARGAVSLGEIRKLKKKGIVVLHPWVNSHEIIEKCDYIFAINSTVALEALYKGKNVISFGKNYLIGHSLVNEIKEFYELFKLYRIEKNNISNEEFFKYLVNAYRHSFPLPASELLNKEINSVKLFPEILMHYLSQK